MQAAMSEPSSATPPQPLIVLAPSAKATVPVGLGPPVTVTVAVKVTLWPKVEGLPEVLTVVVVEPCAKAGTASPSTTSSAAARAAPRRPAMAINRPLPCLFMIDPHLS